MYVVYWRYKIYYIILYKFDNTQQDGLSLSLSKKWNSCSLKNLMKLLFV